MNKLCSFYFFIISFAVFSQNKNTDIKLTKNSDTVFWQKEQKEIIKEFDLPEINKNADYVFRSWKPGSLLEISKKDHLIVGKIYFFVFEVWENDYEADKFVKQYELPNNTSKSLYEFIKKSKIGEIPSDKYIKEWKQGLDGVTFIYEIKNQDSYSFKKYWTPKVQNEINEAKFIIEFNNELGEIGELKKYGEQFFKDVPFPNYMYSGQSYSIIKPLTKKELRQYSRERNKNLEKNKR